MGVVLDRIDKDINQGKEVYPPPVDVFNAYKYTPLEDLKVVILGQDPYHNGQAIGLSFGVDTKPIPPSLRNIYKELCNEYDHVPEEFDYSLRHWAEQGVLMLNTSLTVQKSNAAAHAGLWNFMIDQTIRVINQEAPMAIFVLWGKHAQSYTSKINGAVLKASHPAAEGYGHKGFFGCGHFTEINNRLKSLGKEEIDWFRDSKELTEQEQIEMYQD